MLNRRTLLLASLIAAAAGTTLAAPALDAPAPAFKALTAEGKPLSLADLKGKTVVLEWTNHDCPYVRKHYGAANIQAQQKAATAQGVVWLQVISSAPGEQGHVDGPTALKLNQSRGAAATAVLLDPQGEIGRAYAAKTTPHLFVIRPDGRLAYKGGIDAIASADPADIAKAKQYVPAALADLAAGRAVADASTRPYGCSVKYAS